MHKADELRSYQVKAVEFLLANPSAGLFLDMGLGKTVAMLTALYEFKQHGVGPALVVGPIRVIETVWRQEAEEWEHLNGALTFSLVRGTPAERCAALAAPADVYLINPHQLEWLLDELGDGLTNRFGTLVIDESSMFKNVSTKRFKLLRHKLHNFQRRYILTGTPTPNSLLELWTQMFLLDRGDRLGTAYSRFRERFFHTTDYLGYKWEPRPNAAEHVYKLVEDIVLRMDAKDYLELPEVVENIVEVQLPLAVRKIYNDLENKMLAEVGDGKVTASNAAVAIGKCWQVANGALYTGIDEATGKNAWTQLHTAKLDALDDILDEVHEPVIVVYQFQHELALLKERLASRNPVVLAESDAVKTVADWNDGKINIMLLHRASGGHGLNLQKGGHVFVLFSLTWSLEQHQQTIARLNRMGQTKPVIVHKIMAANTVDQDLDAALHSKAEGQAALLNSLRAHALERELLN